MLALVLWALFGLTAIVARVLIHLRRTGSTGFIGVSGRVGSAEWVGGATFIAASVLGPSAPLLDVTDVLDPIDALDAAGARAAGVTLYAIGLAGVLWSQQALGRSWRIGVDESEQTALVTAGPFGLVRNPIYTAMTAVFVGLALLAPNVVALASVALLVIALELQTRLVEEPYLLRAQGQPYEDYAGSVGRFVPGLGRLDPRGGDR